MKLEDLQLFLDVAKQGSFDRVAEQYYTTQRTISRKIKNLEQDIGVQLFNRSSNHIQLTAAGDLFVSQATDYLHSMKATINQLQETQGSRQEHLKLGYYSMFDGQLMRDEILSYQLNHPQVSIAFETSIKSTENILSDLALGKIDAGYIIRYGNYPILNEKMMEFKTIFKDKMVLGVSETSDLSDNKVITEEELSHKRVLFYNSEHTDYFTASFRSTLESHFSLFKIKYYYSIEEMIIDCALNKGLIYAPNKLVQNFFSKNLRIKWLPFESKRLSQDYVLQIAYNKKNTSKALKAFISSL